MPTGEDDDDDDENVDGNVYVHAFCTNRVTLSVFCEPDSDWDDWDGGEESE